MAKRSHARRGHIVYDVPPDHTYLLPLFDTGMPDDPQAAWPSWYHAGIKWTKPAGYDQASVDSRDIKNPVFTGVTIKSGTTNTQTEYVTFRGTFAPISYASANHNILFLGAGNTLYYPEAGAHIGAFRAYFELGNGLTAGTPSSPVRAFNLSFSGSADGSSASGIAVVPPANDADGDVRTPGWYTLDGVRLNGKPTKKGLYIHGGRKVVIP